jgi:histidinol phosphatase-like enzyme (inositol monophosphatase family)
VSPLTALREAAAEAARRAGAEALRAWRTDLAIERKADGSPVTAADRAAERAAREWIESRFPRDGIVGEESGAVRADAARRWLIDPIDGTRTFVRGVPLWGSLVAVVEGERVLASAAEFPALGESLAAAEGLGCLCGGTPCRVSSTARLEEATVLATDPLASGQAARTEAWRRLSARAALARTWGDCYGYLLVCTGRAEAMLDAALSPWDAAPVALLTREAGGAFSDWRGLDTGFGDGGIATNAALAQAVRECLGVPLPGQGAVR